MGAEMNKVDSLFGQYQLDFRTLTDVIRSTYNTNVLKTVTFENIRDALSDGQIVSKLWLIDELGKLKISNKTIGIFGGWIGILCRMIQDYLPASRIANIELDASLHLINSYTMPFDNFEFIHSDMFDFDYQNNEFDIYINTSVEHIESLSKWINLIPPDKIVCVQSNNYFLHPQHINCVNTIGELETQVLDSQNIKEIIYTGTLSLPIYDRFMVIART